MRNMIKTVIVAAAVVAGRSARGAPRPSCASSRRSRRSPISAARWAATGSTSRRCRAATRTRTSSRPSRRWCSRSTAPTRWSTSGSIWRSAGCRRWCSSRATGASSADSPATSTRRRRSARGRPERAVRSAARARATSTRSATRTTGSRPRTRAPSRGCWPSASPRSTRRARPRTRPSSRASRRGWRPRRRSGKPRRRRCKGTRIVTYHKSWSYVARWLGLEEVGYIEPKPGIPPTANHTAQLVELMKKNGVRLVVVESFYPSTMAQLRRRQRQGAPGRRAVERRRDARDQDLLRPGRRGDRGAQEPADAHTARARARTWTSAAPALTSASLHSLNVAPVV